VQENTELRGQLSVNEKQLGRLQGYNLDGLTSEELGSLVQALMAAVDRIRITITLRQLQRISADPDEEQIGGGRTFGLSDVDSSAVDGTAEATQGANTAVMAEVADDDEWVATGSQPAGSGVGPARSHMSVLPAPRVSPLLKAATSEELNAEAAARQAQNATAAGVAGGACRHKFSPSKGLVKWSGWPTARERRGRAVFTGGDISLRTVAISTAQFGRAGPCSMGALLRPSARSKQQAALCARMDSDGSMDMDRELSAEDDPMFDE
jgi:hypothetical protein